MDARNAYLQPGYLLSTVRERVWHATQDSEYVLKVRPPSFLVFPSQMKNVRKMPNDLAKPKLQEADTQNTMGLRTRILGGLHMNEGVMSLALRDRDTHRQRSHRNAPVEMYNPEQIHLAQTSYRNGMRMHFFWIGGRWRGTNILT